MTRQSPNEIILYQSPDGTTRLEVSLHEDTIGLAQTQLAELFDVNVPAVSKHVRNILGSGELDASAAVSKMERVHKVDNLAAHSGNVNGDQRYEC